jgi:hypothetical protein
MKNTIFSSFFSSKYCIAVFTVVFLLSWFLVPKTVLHGWYLILAVLFTVSLALTITCIVRNVKERIAQARTYGTSLIGLVAAALGWSALQVCGVGASLCGATIGLGVVSSIFPGFLLHFLSSWSVLIVVLSVVAQWISLYVMRCFRKIER